MNRKNPNKLNISVFLSVKIGFTFDISVISLEKVIEAWINDFCRGGAHFFEFKC